MTVVVKSPREDMISLPDWLMRSLNLRDGDKIKTVIEGQTLRMTSLDQFLALRGALKDDAEFDAAMASIEKAWQSWTVSNSAIPTSS
jgi:hypothetical protein